MSQQGPVIFNGRYELQQRLGRGGMAEVYLARDQMLDRPVAVKVLFPALATDPGFVERFRREAQRAASLNHPNVVSVYDWGEANGTYFIVMEYVEGESLAEQIHREGRIHPDRAAEVGSDIAAALGFAHRNGVIHRDVKPGNVLITRDGAVKVADFGIARAISDSSDASLTKTGSVMGTATYFSPEQARGAAVDPRSDLYSLGCVLYEMITGHPPFTGENAVAIAYKHVQEAPVAPRRIDPALPETLEAIVLKCLAKNPANRYPSAPDMRADLRRYLDGARIMAEPVLAPPVDPGATGVMAPTGYMERTTTLAPPTGRYGDNNYGDDGYGGRYEDYDDYDEEPKKPKAFLALLALLILILAGALFMLVRSLNDNDDGGGEATITVPNVVGQPLADAEAQLVGLGLTVQVTREPNAAPADQVFRQDPGPNERLEEGAEVELFVSDGPATSPVPDVVGRPLAEAQQILTDAGFLVQLEPVADDSVAPDHVISQNPPANTPLASGETVTLQVATEPDSVLVPNVVGQPEATAQQALQTAGFDVTVERAASDSVANGNVISQNPGANSQAEPSSTVTIVVSTGRGQANVPRVVGLGEQAAINQLQQAGFEVSVTRDIATNPRDIGRVISQVPESGQAAPGSTVSIVVGESPIGGTTTTTEP